MRPLDIESFSKPLGTRKYLKLPQKRQQQGNPEGKPEKDK